MTGKRLGAMEGGGTKFICAVGTDHEHIISKIRIDTVSPDETLGRALEFFIKNRVEAVGLATFGPLDLNPTSPSYGSVTITPKPGWSGTRVLDYFSDRLDVPIAIELDVNAAAIGEFLKVSKNRKLDTLVYYTIGTGIGAGVITHGTIDHGLTHPEAGHMLLPHDREGDPFPGVCPFHGDCFEGLASGSAIAARWNKPGDHLPKDHPAWDLETGYIASALVNTILMVSPQRIILGGGVMNQRQLFPVIRKKVKKLLNNYIVSLVLAKSMDQFIIPPALGDQSAIAGSFELARKMI